MPHAAQAQGAEPLALTLPPGVTRLGVSHYLHTMRAWAVGVPGPIDSGPLVAVERPIPEPGPGEIRVKVTVCGVCRTDLHLAEGDLAPRRPEVIPGHEIVGVVDLVGEGCSRFQPGDRAGIAWLRGTCGRCRWCRRGAENLCPEPHFTGWDADGGYAEWAVVDEAYAYALPAAFDDASAAPLLCAGIIGYRALRRAELPRGDGSGSTGSAPRPIWLPRWRWRRAPPCTC